MMQELLALKAQVESSIKDGNKEKEGEGVKEEGEKNEV